MSNTSNTRLILIVAVVALAIYVYYTSYYTTAYDEPVRENMSESFIPMGSNRELNKFYEEPTAGVKNHLVDTMTCSKSCCGDSLMHSFDGLTSEEFQRNMSEIQNSTGPYVRTNYTCANGPGGVGCPCIDKQSYKFITNHGHNSHSIQAIEPTFLLGGDVRPFGPKDDEYTPYEVLLTQTSMFVNTPKLNDLELGRMPNPVDNVRSIRD